MNSRLFFVGLLAAASVSCGDGGTEPELQIGSLTFSYSGAESGTFAVSGPLDIDGGPPSSDGAGAVTSNANAVTRITAVRIAGSGEADIIQILLPPVTAPGSFTLDMECLSLSSDGFDCPFAVLGLALPTTSPPPGTTPTPPEGLYVFSSGTVTVTSVTATRITGTFTGTAESISFDLSAPSETVVVTNGTFDVPRLRAGD